MCSAIEAVKGGMKVFTIAREYDVPRMTLQDQILGKVVHGKNPGPQPYLNKTEENELSNFLVETSRVGYGRSRKQVILLVEKTVKDKGLLPSEKKISSGWYSRFMERHPTLTLRKGDPIANVRMECMEKTTMAEHFDPTLTEINLLEKPHQIYNVNETGMPFDHRPPKVVTSVGQKKVRSRTSGNKSVIACVSAAGQVIPPFGGE